MPISADPMRPFLWDVKLPDPKTKTYPASGGRALVLWKVAGEGEWERRAIARATGSALAKAKKEGFDPHDAAELQAKVEALDGEQAWAWLLALLNQRDLTAFEAKRKGAKRGFSATSLNAAIERAQSLHFMDAARYLEAFTTAKIAQGWGERRIRQELKLRGIDVEGYPEWGPSHFGGESERERAAALLSRRSVPEKNPYEKLVRFLVGKGYSLSVAKDAVRARLDSEGA